MQPIDEKTWIAWRCKLGARKSEAKALYREYQEFIASAAGNVRMCRPRHGESFESAFRAFLDQMPRTPSRFLAMVERAQKLREIRARVAARKAVGRARHLRRFNRGAQQRSTNDG